MGSSEEIGAKLQQAGRFDLGDFMTFEVRPDDHHQEIQNEGMQYEGFRFRAECKLAGKLYGQPFGVDAAFGDPMFGDPEVVVGPTSYPPLCPSRRQRGQRRTPRWPKKTSCPGQHCPT